MASHGGYDIEPLCGVVPCHDHYYMLWFAHKKTARDQELRPQWGVCDSVRANHVLEASIRCLKEVDRRGNSAHWSVSGAESLAFWSRLTPKELT